MNIMSFVSAEIWNKQSFLGKCPTNYSIGDLHDDFMLVKPRPPMISL